MFDILYLFFLLFLCVKGKNPLLLQFKKVIFTFLFLIRYLKYFLYNRVWAYSFFFPSASWIGPASNPFMWCSFSLRKKKQMDRKKKKIKTVPKCNNMKMAYTHKKWNKQTKKGDYFVVSIYSWAWGMLWSMVENTSTF